LHSPWFIIANNTIEVRKFVRKKNFAENVRPLSNVGQL